MKRKSLSLTGIVNVIDVGLTSATLLGFFGKLFWIFDLFSHFRVQYMQLCLLMVGFSIWKRLNKRAIIFTALACLNYAFVLPLYFGKPSPAPERPARAMLMNLNAGNGNTAQVLKAITAAGPDILLLEEVTPKWADALKGLDKEYAHRLARPREDCFGIMLLSKYPLAHMKEHDIGNSGVPTLTAVAYTPGGEISVIGTHPVPPVGPAYSKSRNRQLAGLSELVKEQKYPVLLIGDLNTTPWSHHFSKLARSTGLKNSMKGFGFQPTWPANIPWVRIPIDHVLHTPEITVHNRVIGGNIGSDHFPVIVDFTIR
jgi:endonuclease/exonuclease/phosphatase (EEP) superfamily protein YafD